MYKKSVCLYYSYHCSLIKSLSNTNSRIPLVCANLSAIIINRLYRTFLTIELSVDCVAVFRYNDIIHLLVSMKLHEHRCKKNFVVRI